MNLQEAQAALLARGFDYLTPEQTTLMLNAGKDAFEDIWAWPWLTFMISNPAPIPLPDLKFVLSVKLADGTELLGLDIRQVLQNGATIDDVGTPEYWYVFWQLGMPWLRVWPGDGGSNEVTIVYTADTAPLVDPDDTPLIPTRYHSVWIDFAVCEAYKDSDNFPAAQALRADITLRMHDVIARYEVVNRQHSPFMTVRAINEDD